MYVMNNNQVLMAQRLVEELRRKNALDDVISRYGIEGVRVCRYCNGLMNEGWLYCGDLTYCSERCLLADNPDEDIETLKEEVERDDSDSFWTTWE